MENRPKEEFKPFQPVYPLPFVFRYHQSLNRNPAADAVDPMWVYDIYRVRYPKEGGMDQWFRDCPYPFHGFPYPEALMMINGVKRLWIGMVRAFTHKDAWLLGVALFLSPSRSKIIDRFLLAMGDAAKRMNAQAILCPKRCTKPVRELWSICYILVREGLGVSDATARVFSEALMMIIEYDNAYRWRIQDLFTASSKEKLLKNPTKELKRLAALLRSRTPQFRESLVVADKYDAAVKILSLLWLILPRWRKAWKKAVGQADFNRLQFDEADKYHLLLNSDYDYLGLSIERRSGLWEDFHRKHPPFPRRIQVIPVM